MSTDVEGDGEELLPRAGRETLAIPASVRAAVDDRDGQRCRVCGRYLGDERAIHHIRYGGDLQGMGGRRNHDLSGLVSICWMWGKNCHDMVHARKALWQPYLLAVVARPGTTAMQLRRWSERSRGRGLRTP